MTIIAAGKQLRMHLPTRGSARNVASSGPRPPTSLSRRQAVTNRISSTTLADSATRLRAAFVARPIDDDVLKSAVCAYADEAKRLGWPVERVIIEIKRMSEIESGPIYRQERSDRTQGQRIVERVVTWCVEHYYRAAPRASRPLR